MDWKQWFSDPTTGALVFGAGGMVLVVIVAALLSQLSSSRRARAARARIAELASHNRLREEEVVRFASRVIATSSTPQIAGFTIGQQIEAVFVEGARSPAEAVEQLKAEAARKGANAIINLDARRLPSGRCSANGDAVIVNRTAGGESTQAPPK